MLDIPPHEITGLKSHFCDSIYWQIVLQVWSWALSLVVFLNASHCVWEAGLWQPTRDLCQLSWCPQSRQMCEELITCWQVHLRSPRTCQKHSCFSNSLFTPSSLCPLSALAFNNLPEGPGDPMGTLNWRTQCKVPIDSATNVLWCITGHTSHGRICEREGQGSWALKPTH